MKIQYTGDSITTSKFIETLVNVGLDRSEPIESSDVANILLDSIGEMHWNSDSIIDDVSPICLDCIDYDCHVIMPANTPKIASNLAALAAQANGAILGSLVANEYQTPDSARLEGDTRCQAIANWVSMFQPYF